VHSHSKQKKKENLATSIHTKNLRYPQGQNNHQMNHNPSPNLDTSLYPIQEASPGQWLVRSKEQISSTGQLVPQTLSGHQCQISNHSCLPWGQNTYKSILKQSTGTIHYTVKVFRYYYGFSVEVWPVCITNIHNCCSYSDYKFLRS
jgi:hypothetical protein